jgi:hypothetical protein
MKQFTLKPEAGKKLRRAIYLRLLATILFAVAAMALLQLTGSWFFSSPPISGLIIGSAFLFTSYLFDLRKAARTASSYKLTVSDDALSREIKKTKTLCIMARDVRFITRYDDGSYIIIGNDSLNPIKVPAGIEQPEELELMLTTMTNQTIRSQNFQWYKLIVLFTVLFLSIVVALFSENKYIGTIFGLLVIGTIVYCWTVVQLGKDYDRKLRLVSHVTLVLVIAVAARIIWHWAM